MAVPHIHAVFIGKAKSIALRLRVKAIWPTASFLSLAVRGSIFNIQASRRTVPQGLGHIAMSVGVRSSFLATSDVQVHALVILLLIGLPFLLLTLRRPDAVAH